jgi:hypothetical protein
VPGSQEDAVSDERATAEGGNPHWKAKWIRFRDDNEK